MSGWGENNKTVMWRALTDDPERVRQMEDAGGYSIHDYRQIEDGEKTGEHEQVMWNQWDQRWRRTEKSDTAHLKCPSGRKKKKSTGSQMERKIKEKENDGEEEQRERNERRAIYNFSKKAIYVILECSECFPLNKYVLILYAQHDGRGVHLTSSTVQYIHIIIIIISLMTK